MQNHTFARRIVLSVATLVTLGFIVGLLASSALLAQDENDYPLPLPPDIQTGTKAEPLLFIGDYCGAFGGVSLHDTDGGPGDFTVDVVGEPIEAFIVWSGRNRLDRTGDDNLEVSVNGAQFMTIVADQALLARSDADFSWFTYSFDALAGGVPIVSGANRFVFQGLEDGDDTFEAHGVGVLIIGEDHAACPFQALGIYFGNDVLFHGWDGASGPDSEPVCFDFPPPPDPLEMDIQMFVGGVENPYRANAIWARTGNGGAKPATILGDPDAVELRMALRGLQGDEFDNYDTVIQDPNPIIVDAGDTWACVQIESPPEVHNERFPALIIDGEPLPEAKRQGISATWITHAMRVPLAEIEIGPDGLNRVGEPHDFTITVNSAFGFAGTLVITPTVSPRPDSQTDTCATPTIDGRIATCVLTINSDKSGIFTANAAAAVDLGNGLSAHLSTAIARESNGGSAVKEYVEPAIDLEKATNGEDADEPTGPFILAGETVTWRYRVENTGAMDLINVVVTDDNGTPRDPADDFTCAIPALAIGEVDSTTCLQTGVAQIGQYGNIAVVVGTPVIDGEPRGEPVTDEDPEPLFRRSAGN